MSQRCRGRIMLSAIGKAVRRHVQDAHNLHAPHIQTGNRRAGCSQMFNNPVRKVTGGHDDGRLVPRQPLDTVEPQWSASQWQRICGLFRSSQDKGAEIGLHAWHVMGD